MSESRTYFLLANLNPKKEGSHAEAGFARVIPMRLPVRHSRSLLAGIHSAAPLDLHEVSEWAVKLFRPPTFSAAPRGLFSVQA
jgi:hypothetical protein